MEQSAGDTFPDNEPIETREKTLKRVVFERDIFLPRGFLDKSKIRGRVLDIGCGKGAVGAVLKEVNPEIELIGCDIKNYSRRENRLDVYSEIRKGFAFDVLLEAKERGGKFDVIVSCGLPFSGIKDIFENVEIDDVLSKTGIALFMFDDNTEERTTGLAKSKGFEIREGSFPADRSIWFKRKP